MPNLILRTDSYKQVHHQMYNPDITGVYSYYESRPGARFPETVFFGLEPLLRSIQYCAVTKYNIDEAEELCYHHFGNVDRFNRVGWERIVNQHNGMLPLEVKAVPEGTVVPVGNVMATFRNTDPALPWLTNALESIFMHLWYPCTVATLSRSVKKDLAYWLEVSGDSPDGLDFMLHDFGYRSAAGDEQAALGGAAHLVNFKGTDTLVALLLARDMYNADLTKLGFSVPATEHSVMTSEGKAGEFPIVERLLDQYPTGILSVVADSYNIYDFMDFICSDRIRERILAREGKFVVRPDSVTDSHPTPTRMTVEVLRRLLAFGSTRNEFGYVKLNPKVGCLWGDGLDREAINSVMRAVTSWGFAASNMVFGMGGGLLQKGIDRDTQRSAIKASAILRNGIWEAVSKETPGKSSKRGRLKLIQTEAGYQTIPAGAQEGAQDHLEDRFYSGLVLNSPDFESIRLRAAIDPPRW